MRYGAPPTTVLVPLDGSWRSEAALVPAVPLALRTGARLVLLSAQWSASDLGTTRTYLEGRRAALFDLGFDGQCGIEAVLERDAAAAIGVAASEPGTLVCMATHGHGGVIRGVLGSVAEAVVRAGNSPVLFVGPSLDPQWRLPEPPTTPEIVLALDGSPTSREAIPAAISLARAIAATVRVVHVPHPGDAPGADLPQVVTTFAGEGVDATFDLIDGFDPAAAIAAVAAEHRAAFVVAATHGRTGLARVTLGSVVQRMVRRASCPVFVVRPVVLTAARPDHEVGGAGATGEETAHARRGWRRDRGRPQPSRSATP
jgi:nucleotide-binding universal stress UspA family protein